MSDAQQHWQTVFTTKAEDEVSWFQAVPALSLDLIAANAPDRAAAIIDIGGGELRLPDALIERGYADITVLDISEAALARSRARLAARAARVRWIATDITRWQPERQWTSGTTAPRFIF